MQLVLITGLSGSGKSVALDVLEDASYYCIDNLPVQLLPDLVAYLQRERHERVALTMDVRSGQSVEELPRDLEALRAQGIAVKVLFLEAKTDTLLRRFSETRRRHPLSEGTLTLTEAISRERDLLQGIAASAHHIDTSDLNPNGLRAWVKDFVGLKGTGLTLLFESFGYKNGVPLDADLVFDVRCLPNPHYDPQLRPLTGRDVAVIEFLRAESEVGRLLHDIGHFVESWLPYYRRDNRSYLTVAIGCTGGRHRSVYMTENLAQRFGETMPVLVRHRELA
ncbi:MAG: RNase adapter RapZ [Rhodospirillaceae bacterium]